MDKSSETLHQQIQITYFDQESLCAAGTAGCCLSCIFTPLSTLFGLFCFKSYRARKSLLYAASAFSLLSSIALLVYYIFLENAGSEKVFELEQSWEYNGKVCFQVRDGKCSSFFVYTDVYFDSVRYNECTLVEKLVDGEKKSFLELIATILLSSSIVYVLFALLYFVMGYVFSTKIRRIDESRV